MVLGRRLIKRLESIDRDVPSPPYSFLGLSGSVVEEDSLIYSDFCKSGKEASSSFSSNGEGSSRGEASSGEGRS